MQHTIPHRQGAVGIVIGVIIVVVVGIGAWYLVSDTFSTKLDQAFEQGTKWTSENIQADPVGYLTWAMKQTTATEGRLKASQLALKTKQNQANRGLEKTLGDQATYQKLLDEAKAAYQEAKANDSWPTKIAGTQADERQLKKIIVDTHNKMKNLNRLVDTYRKTAGVIDTKLGEVESKLSELTEVKMNLSSQLEVAKVNQSVAGIGDIHDQLGAIIDTSNALASSTTSDELSIESLVAPTGEQRVDSEFDAIMDN
jgi:chromosome segregation ATPase